jgi:hypothetical protein
MPGALLYRFARVVGVELSPDLAAVARDNVERNRSRLRTFRVEIVVSDVLEYPIPDDVTIAFFHNPFTGPVFRHVISGLLASVNRSPRRVRIVYLVPAEEGMMLQTGRIRRVASGRSFLSRRRAHAELGLYEVDPESPERGGTTPSRTVPRRTSRSCCARPAAQRNTRRRRVRCSRPSARRSAVSAPPRTDGPGPGRSS